MKTILTIIKLSELPEFWYKDFPFDALSVKPSIAKQARLLLARVPAPAHPELHLWEWFPCRTPNEGTTWGRKMAEACVAHSATRFYVNAEAEWSGVERFARTDDPYETLLAAMTAFYLHAPDGCELFYNGFSWARTSDGRKLHDAAMMRAFAGWCPMIYGTSPGTIVEGFRSKLNKYRKDCPSQIRTAMVGVGRVDREGRRWGFWEPTVRAARAMEADELAFFFGNGARSRYFEDADHHPALVKCAREVACG